MNKANRLAGYRGNQHQSYYITNQDIAILFRQLSDMTQTGMSLNKSFEIAIRNIKKTKMKKLALKMQRDLNRGVSLSNVLKKHPAYFESLICLWVEEAELTGSLDTVLVRIAARKESIAPYLSIKQKWGFPITATFITMIIVGLVVLITTNSVSVKAWWILSK